MATTGLLSKEHVLGKTYRGFDVKPLGKVYYGAFPLRVTLRFSPDPDTQKLYQQTMSDFLGSPVDERDFNTDQVDRLVVGTRLQRAQRVILKSLGDIEYRKSRSVGDVYGYHGSDTYSSEYRGELRLFLPTTQALDLVLDYANGKNIQEVEGLQSLEQLELMNNPRFKSQGRKHKFHNKFDFKVDIQLNVDSTPVAVKAALKTVKEFLCSQATPDEYTIRKNWKKITVFANQELVLNVLPMIRFELKIEEFAITRAIVAE